MSAEIDPFAVPTNLSELEYETLRGRLMALELLAAQSWVFNLSNYPNEHLDDLVADLQIELENRFDRLHPVAQRAASESVDGILSSALATVRRDDGDEKSRPD